MAPESEPALQAGYLATVQEALSAPTCALGQHH
jgi:hypothetical protein